jgi:hypothetical protein
MKPIVSPLGRLLAVAGVLVVSGLTARAFPPAPHQEVFGLIRNEQGVPIVAANAEVVLETGGNLLGRTTVSQHLEPGVNYRLAIPLDSGVTGDSYSPTALRPTVPFRLRVKIGNVTYLPIEMSGASSLLTKPGAAIRVDLTLGEDSDGDGIPDAWERQLIAGLGGGKSLADINPNDDSDGDGLSNLLEYLAGTYAFDPQDGFSLSIVSTQGDRPVLEFLAIRGRDYEIQGSTDLKSWTRVTFSLSTDAVAAPFRDSFRATDTRVRRPVVAPTAGEQPRFFKLIVH